MAETSKNRLNSPPGTTPTGNGVSGGGESGFHPQQMHPQQFPYGGKFQTTPTGLHQQRHVMVSYDQHAVFQQQGPYAHHGSYQQLPHQQQQQLQYQQQQRQQLHQQQQMQYIPQPENLQHPMQYIKDTQKSSLSQSQQHLDSSDLESQDGESPPRQPTVEDKPPRQPTVEEKPPRQTTVAEKTDHSTVAGSAKEVVRTPAEMEKLTKELEAVRAAHEKQVRELEAKIKSLEEKKSQKEVKYLRVRSSGQKKSLSQEEDVNTSQVPEEGDAVDTCPSPVRSVHSDVSIKEEPDDGIQTRNIQRTFFQDSDEEGDSKDLISKATLFGLGDPRQHIREFWEKPNVNEIFMKVKNKEIGMKDAAEQLDCTYGFTYTRYREIYGSLTKDVNDDTKIPTSVPENKPTNTYTLSVTDFEFCIFCQSSRPEKKMSHVTEDSLATLQTIVLNVECEASQRLKDYVFDVDMFFNNLPQYHSDCHGKYKGKLQHIRRKRKNLEETDFSLCIYCQEHRNEPLYNLTSKGIASGHYDLNKFDDEKIEKLKIIFNYDRIKKILEVESAKEEFSSDKLKFHKPCRHKFMSKDRPRKKLTTSTSEPENKEDNVEMTPDEEIFELLAKREKKIEEEKEKKQRKELPNPNEFDYKKKCILCGTSSNRGGNRAGNRVDRPRCISSPAIQKTKDNAEKNQHSDIIKIVEHGVDFDIELLCHDKCYRNYNYLKHRKVKKGTRDHYETAFRAVVTEIEDPMFRNGKVFSLVELREKFLKNLMEFKIESDQKMKVFVTRIKDYYTFNRKCRVSVVPHPDNFIYSNHFSESQITPQINILRGYKENEGDENSQSLEQVAEDLTDSNKDSMNSKIKKKFSCTECDYKCNKKKSLKNHIKKKHGPRNEEIDLSEVMCEICGKMLRNKKSLKTHVRRHSGEKYYCLQCDKTYLSKSSLDNHKLIHTGEKNEECPECGKKFSLKKYLKRHLKEFHGTKTTDKPFLCSICGNSFRTKERLKEHSRKHSDDKPFICKECGKAFKYRSVRRTHELAHKGKKPQMCSICSFGCYTKANLKLHMAIHTGCNEQIMCSNNDNMDEKSVLEKYINLDEIPNIKTQTYFPL